MNGSDVTLVETALSLIREGVERAEAAPGIARGDTLAELEGFVEAVLVRSCWHRPGLRPSRPAAYRLVLKTPSSRGVWWEGSLDLEPMRPGHFRPSVGPHDGQLWYAGPPGFPPSEFLCGGEESEALQRLAAVLLEGKDLDYLAGDPAAWPLPDEGDVLTNAKEPEDEEGEDA